MKIIKLGILGSTLLLSQLVFAQNPDIKEADVSRVIKTLSADDMRGRSALSPADIGKAADFIASEFKQAGLKYFDRASSYRQNFDLVSSKFLGGKLEINGKEVDPANYALSSTEKEINWTSLPKVETIGAEDNFYAKSLSAIQSKDDLIIMVDPSQSKIFPRMKTYMARGGKSLTGSNSGTKLFILSAEEPKSINAHFTNKVTKIPLYNVVGVLPGKSKPNEYVVFSGHYDHLGIIKPVGQDSIANGADDDASGTTAVIELAKYFGQKKNNERTLIFVAFTAEEIGEYGSQYFAKTVNPADVVAMFNIEMIGKDSKFGKNNAFITGYDRSDFGKILQKNLEGSDFKFYPDPYPKQNLFFRSDNASLAKVGVSAHTISSDQIDTDKLYHSVGDEYETMDISNITEIIKAIAISSTSIVNGTDTPTRITGVN